MNENSGDTTTTEKVTGGLWDQLTVLSGYYITQPPTPDHEFVQVCNGDLRKMVELMNTSGQAPAPHMEPVQDTYFVDRSLPVMAISGDVESDRVLKLHFRRPVSDEDRKALTDALNLHQRSIATPPPPHLMAYMDGSNANS